MTREAEQSPVLDDFGEAAMADFIGSPVLNADETGISVNGVIHWIHNLGKPHVHIFLPARG
jgi:hypothetical protein